ncbi:SNF2 domain containing protein [Acanthamoeba castellanii str. Neff]|uniref:SNF2 domain containing protein n=1 Tax=Acanthamoeba castellanii (strain ATCC 30010 / Neff) TaxID=1257118 RepID=L8GPT3_ACACF|nr:SNF2 domain containing protein [Acanthamoeba castellanii str. Neff]ELR14643.1 SNF2 domain containing protein [Acanthamoeba castellanii str. Neff]
MFSDESEEEEEEAPSDKKQRGKEARPAAKGGMMDKLRMLARQTGSEAIEDAAQSDGSESEAKEERDSEDEHDSECPTDEQMEGDDYEAECIAEDDDEKRPPTPTNKAKTLQKVKTEREVEREEKKAHKSEAIEQEEAEEEGEEEEESEEEEEETPSWKRLRKFVEVKDEPRTSEKKSDSSGKKKAATAAELKGKTKDAVKTEAKKGKNADEDFVEEEVERVQLWKGLSIPAKMWDGLYPYQKRGVEFMWSLYTKKTGGILGDEMGLGKTIQALVLVLGALTSGRAKRVLIVMPLSVMKNWENELMKWSDNGAMLESRGMGICIMHGAMNKKKNEIKDKVFHHEGGLCFTTYGNIPTKLASFVSINWDIVLLDEGHKIKNHRIGLSQSMRRIPSTTRILLTGTPIQNNLMELWSLFDYTCKGQLLGTIHQFGRQFEQPIKYATYKCASAEEKQLSHELSKQLRHILAPHFLRREKKDVFNTNGSASKADAGDQSSPSPSSSEERQQQALTTRMNDFIVWLSLSPVQEKLYRSFLASDQVKNVLATTKNVLEGLVLLKKLCDHPRLLTAKNAEAVDAELLATWCDWLRDKQEDDEDSEKPKRAAKRNTRATSDDEDEDDAAEESESEDEDEEVDHLPVTRQAAKRKPLIKAKVKTEISGGRRLAVDEFNTRLPHEVKLRIFGFACGLNDVVEVSRLMLVCSHWRQVASDDALWFPLCRHQSFVDARGRDLQAMALANAARREAQRAKEEAREARHTEDVGKEIPIPPKEASWRECFLRKRRECVHQISAKLVFLMRLLPKLREEGSRVLVFSQSRKMLNIIELLLREGDYSFLRIDGSISKSDERQRRVELFNSDPSYFCFLLTTVVGGIGLNLTGADRVVIVDPSWNPTHDNQAVCRAFRLGQKKNVIVYRLITCGTIEEKIYRRQVFKGAIVQSTMTQKSSLRYFSREELTDLFHLGDPRVAQTQKDLHALHAHERVTDEYTDRHIQYLHEIGGVHGISDHDLLFSKTQAVESSAVAKQQAKEAARHLKNQNSDDEGDDEGARDLVKGGADGGAGEAAYTPASQPRTRGGAEEEAKTKREVVTGSAPPARRRRPRESIVDTALNAFTPPVTVYSRVIEKTRMRRLAASPASSSALIAATPQRKTTTTSSSSRPLPSPAAVSSSSLRASATRKHAPTSASKKATTSTTREDKENNKPRANAKRLDFDD